MYQAKSVTTGCTYGNAVSLDLIAESKGIPEKDIRKEKEKSLNRLACLVILDRYSNWLDDQNFPTVFLYESASKMCNAILTTDWYLSTGEWSHGKLIAASNKTLWSKFLLEAYDPQTSNDQWSPYNYTNRKVLNLSVQEYQTLLILQ